MLRIQDSLVLVFGKMWIGVLSESFNFNVKRERWVFIFQVFLLVISMFDYGIELCINKRVILSFINKKFQVGRTPIKVGY